LKASNTLAQEKGPCEYFDRTKYSDGILPIDTYKKDLDEIIKRKLSYDWTTLRKNIRNNGLRHSTLSAQMPSESSSIVSNATNGVEPPRDYLSIKKSKKGPLKQIVPDYNRLKNFYTLLWDMKSNEGYINLISIMQKYFDQAISGNWSYNPENYTDGEVPLSIMANDLLTTYKLGWKKDDPCYLKIELNDKVPTALLNNSAKKIKNKEKLKILKKYIKDPDKIKFDENMKVAIITPDIDIIPDANTLNPAYLVFENYEIILKWNRSLRFGLAVCNLKDKFKNEI